MLDLRRLLSLEHVVSYLSRALVPAALLIWPALALAQQQAPSQLIVAEGITAAYPANWSLGQSVYSNAKELFSPAASEMTGQASPGQARIVLMTETRLDHADALNRLMWLANSYDAAPTIGSIGGWPAIVIRRQEPLATIGEDTMVGPLQPAWKVTIAVAYESTVALVQGTLPPGASTSVADQVEAIGRSLTFPTVGDPIRVQQEIDSLVKRPRPLPPAHGPGPAAENSTPISAAEASSQGSTGARINNGPGGDSEIEVAVSTDGRNIVVVNNSKDFTTSTDGGRTFVANSFNPAFPSNGDPSIAFGRSGAFYLAFIATPDVDNDGDGTNNCATSIAVSTNGGQAFTFRAHAFVSPDVPPGVSFPDQEHIAADRFNASPSGGDQIYSAWRDFTSGGATSCRIGSGSIDVTMVCSQDSGNNWTPKTMVDPNGDFPRPTVGQDGFVYVAYQIGGTMWIHKFSACGAGFAPQPGFPRPVSAFTAVVCPVAGLDRCNDGNSLSSPTAAVDDTNADHIYFSFASSTGGGNEDVFVVESTDGGTNWSAPVQINNGILAKRYMPWVCSVGGAAYVGWYDRRASIPTSNDLTDFFVGRAFVNPSGNLAAGTEMKISTVSDAQCASGWPSAPRSTNDSESCSTQPQLAGFCADANPATADSNLACDYSDCPGISCTCPAGETCNTGGGRPKYGDYNGIGCAAGRVYPAWASATSPAGTTPASTDIDVFIQPKIVCCVPQIQVPGSVSVPGACPGIASTATLSVCNTGKGDLEVASISSSNTQFSVTTPSSGFPVVISPDFCFPFQVTFTPTSSGAMSTTLTITSNDSVNPTVTVTATGAGLAPRIATLIADSGNFGDVCRASFRDLALTISNSGGCDLTVSNITSNDAEFKTATVLTYPVVVAAGGNVAVPIRFEPATLGAKSATITIDSNDPATPAKLVGVSGIVPPGDVRVTGSTDFGDVCAGVLAEKTVSVCNVGKCNLNVASVALNAGCLDFRLINSPFPAPVSPDSCESVVIQFTPTSVGPKVCTLTITTDDPDSPVVIRTLTGNTPAPSIDVPPDLGFPPTVIQSIGSCNTPEPFPVSNTGQCNLSITSLAISNNPTEYSLSGLPSFPIVLQPGHVAGEGNLATVFAPVNMSRADRGSLTVTYLSDPITGTTTSVTRALCGEGVRTGARVLVTAGGIPLATVELIKLTRINANRNRNLLDTVDTAKNLALQTVVPGAPCTPFQYHREYSTVSNQIQLLPGSYQVTVTAIVNGRRVKKSVGFDVNTCGFNPTITVNF